MSLSENEHELDAIFEDMAFGHNFDYGRKAVDKYIKNKIEETRVDAVNRIMSVKTEGLFDGGDLFIKRAPIEQACIGLIGYEAFKAIQESLPSANLGEEMEK
jgi:hypothetical protein